MGMSIMFNPRYELPVRLLLRCLPEIARHRCFALKGGTAINLFVQDLPRASVDIGDQYERRFRGMSRFEVSLDDLREV